MLLFQIMQMKIKMVLVCNMINIDLKQIHGHLKNNKDEIKNSEKCGCFYCKKIFKGSEVKDWIKDETGDTAKCPYCLVDSVIGDASGLKLTEELLEIMNKTWFE